MIELGRREVFPVRFVRGVVAAPSVIAGAKASTLKAPSQGERIAGPALSPAAPFLVEAPRQAINRAAAEVRASSVPSPIAKPVAAALDTVGQVIAPLGPIGGVFGAFGVRAIGIRGRSQAQQRATFGQATVATVQTAAGFVPFVGAALAAGVGALAQTGTGARITAEAGRGIERGYQFQKNVLKGDFTGGDKTQHDRKRSFFALVDSRVAELMKGGKLTATDIGGLEQAKAYGYVYSGGFDLRTLKLEAGTNPFLSRKAG